MSKQAVSLDMIGLQTDHQKRLFYSFDLEEHVPQNHLLRGINQHLDLSDFRQHLSEYYSHTGRPSIDPELIIRMLIIGYSFGTVGASFVLGHNVVQHDLPVLKRIYPDLTLLSLPIIDTLQLSPIAFPQNPYHSLVKDYKLVRDSINDPLKDAQLALNFS